jgi:hypothetical protein
MAKLCRCGDQLQSFTFAQSRRAEKSLSRPDLLSTFPLAGRVHELVNPTHNKMKTLLETLICCAIGLIFAALFAL